MSTGFEADTFLFFDFEFNDSDACELYLALSNTSSADWRNQNDWQMVNLLA